jgi:hypothetical protein
MSTHAVVLGRKTRSLAYWQILLLLYPAGGGNILLRNIGNNLPSNTAPCHTGRAVKESEATRKQAVVGDSKPLLRQLRKLENELTGNWLPGRYMNLGTLEYGTKSAST